MEEPTAGVPPDEWEERLEAHMAMAMEALAACAAAGEAFQPVVAFVKADGSEELAILVFDAEGKERAIAQVTRQAREGGCRALILVGDAWAAPAAAGREPRPGDAVRHPQREECLTLTLFTPNGAWGRTVRYARAEGTITFQPPDPWFSPHSPWNPWADVQ